MRNNNWQRKIWLTWMIFYYSIVIAWTSIEMWAIRQRQAAVERAWKRHLKRYYQRDWGKHHALWFTWYANALYRLERLPSGIIYLVILRRLP